MAHEHSAHTTETRAYNGGASDQRAAGNITDREICTCGAYREVHINGRWQDASEWDLPEWVADANPEAIAFRADDARRLLLALSKSRAGRQAIVDAGYEAILGAPDRGDDKSTLAVAMRVMRRMRNRA